MSDLQHTKVIVRNLFKKKIWTFDNDIIWTNLTEGISSIQVGDYTGVIIYLNKEYVLKKENYGYDIVKEE